MPGAIWLDVTRLLTRVGRGALSGIDRVEAAYLEHLLSVGGGTRFLCRTTRGYILLGADGAAELLSLSHGSSEPGRADVWSRLTLRGGRPRHRAEAALRRFALDRCPHWALHRMIARQASAPCVYLNTGHSNLTRQTLAPLSAAGARIAVFVHDIIPITHPDLGPPTQAASFATKLGNTAAYADLVICNSDDTGQSLARFWQKAARRPACVTAHLGVTPIRRVQGSERSGTGFVMLGTIEPRKNHAVILDAWRILSREIAPEDMPLLHIIGAPGWRGTEIAQTIQSHPLAGQAIHLHGSLPDDQVARHLATASALLYPSQAEGFGLPPLEALAQGALPICADLPVLREVLGPRAVYLNPNDAYSWAETIKQRMTGKLTGPTGEVADLPEWQDHFDRVAAALSTRDRPEQEGKG